MKEAISTPTFYTGVKLMIVSAFQDFAEFLKVVLGSYPLPPSAIVKIKP